MHPIDPTDWLHRLSPRDWIGTALAELERAEGAFANRDRKGALACCRRAAGMALNGLLAASEVPDGRYGRSYMDHVIALQADETAPDEVRAAARLLVSTPLPGGPVVALHGGSLDERIVEATRTVMAHALAAVIRSEPG